MTLFEAIKGSSPKFLAEILALYSVDAIENSTMYRKAYKGKRYGNIVQELEWESQRYLKGKNTFWGVEQDKSSYEGYFNCLYGGTVFTEYVKGGISMLSFIMAKEKATLIFHPNYRGNLAGRKKEEIFVILRAFYLKILMFNVKRYQAWKKLKETVEDLEISVEKMQKEITEIRRMVEAQDNEPGEELGGAGHAKGFGGLWTFVPVGSTYD